MKSQQQRVPPRQLGQLSPDVGGSSRRRARGPSPAGLVVMQPRGPPLVWRHQLCWWVCVRFSSLTDRMALGQGLRVPHHSGQVGHDLGPHPVEPPAQPLACILSGEARQRPRCRQVTRGPCVPSLPFRGMASRLRSQAPRWVATGCQGSSRCLVKSLKMGTSRSM